MIIGNINDKSQYDFISKDERIKCALDYIRAGKFVSEAGVREPIGEGCIAFVNKIETREFTGKYEAHKKYLDLFYVINGVEKVCVTKTAGAEICEEYSEEKDIFFVNAEEGMTITLNEGDYIIVFPEDAHAPALGDGSLLEKLIIKIPV
ncbi:MAG: YhcH/YjgK/YiaL family protein [Firmicutes bacterium]|nr:YhcH/YjgK/YiaL family protein [Bacillota bacterium]